VSRDYSLIDPDRGFGATVAALSERLAEVERLVTTLGPGTRKAFTPAVTFGGSASNVTSSGSWWFDGDLVEWEMEWSTSGAPNVGVMRYTLPVAHASNPGTPGLSPNPTVGFAVLLNSTIQRYRMFAVLDDSTTVGLLDMGIEAGQNIVSGVNPFTWGAADVGYASGRYRWR